MRPGLKMKNNNDYICSSAWVKYPAWEQGVWVGEADRGKDAPKLGKKSQLYKKGQVQGLNLPVSEKWMMCFMLQER